MGKKNFRCLVLGNQFDVPRIIASIAGRDVTSKIQQEKSETTVNRCIYVNAANLSKDKVSDLLSKKEYDAALVCDEATKILAQLNKVALSVQVKRFVVPAVFSKRLPKLPQDVMTLAKGHDLPKKIENACSSSKTNDDEIAQRKKALQKEQEAEEMKHEISKNRPNSFVLQTTLNNAWDEPGTEMELHP